MSRLLFDFLDSQLLETVGIPSSATLGTPSLNVSVHPVAMDATESLGSPVVTEGLAVTGIPSTATVGTPSILQRRLIPETGTFLGGDTFRYISAGMAVPGDTFASGTLSPSLWTSAVAGSGVVQIVGSSGPRGVLQLRTGATAGSSARIRSTDAVPYSDAEISFNLSSVVTTPTTRHIRGTLGLYQDANNLFRFALETDAYGVAQLKILGLVSGQAVVNTTLLTAFIPIGGTATLRILRVASRVLLFVGSTKIYETAWSSAPTASVEIGLENASSATSSATMSVLQYTRRPVVLFGTEPVTNFSYVSDSVVDGVTPAVSPDTETVDIRVYSTALQTFLDAWTYSVPEELIGVGAGLQIVNDTTLRNPIVLV